MRKGGREGNSRPIESLNQRRAVGCCLTAAEVVLVREDRVVRRRLGRSDQSRVRLQVEFLRHRRHDGFAVCRERKQTGCQILGFRRKVPRKETNSTTVPVV